MLFPAFDFSVTWIFIAFWTSLDYGGFKSSIKTGQSIFYEILKCFRVEKVIEKSRWFSEGANIRISTIFSGG